MKTKYKVNDIIQYDNVQARICGIEPSSKGTKYNILLVVVTEENLIEKAKNDVSSYTLAKVETPVGTLTAEHRMDVEYPGFNILLEDCHIAVAEYCPTRKTILITAYPSKDNEEPSYIGAVDIKTEASE